MENEIIKNIGFDESFEKIYLNLISRYSETLKGTLRKMLEVAITLKDDESKVSISVKKKSDNDYKDVSSNFIF